MVSVDNAISVLELGVGLCKSIKDRCEKASANSDLADDLSDRLHRLPERIRRLGTACDENTMNHSPEVLANMQDQVDDFSSEMRRIVGEMRENLQVLKRHRQHFTRAKSLHESLSQLLDRTNKLREQLSQMTQFLATGQGTAQIVSGFTSVTSAVDKGFHKLASAMDKEDCFIPYFVKPINPRHVVLNFCRKAEMTPRPHGHASVESRLKWTLLQGDCSSSSGPYCYATHHAVGVVGMSGVGKSCALRGLAFDKEVQEHFYDGIYWITLGKNATETDVVQQIVRMTKQSGGSNISKSISEEKSIDIVVSEARDKWFAGKRILILIDDVWEFNELGQSIVQRLGSIASTGSGSRVVFTTRDWNIVGQNEEIEFSKRSEDLSRQILLSAAGLGTKEVKPLQGAIRSLLELCDGLPMALSVVGNAIAVRRKCERGSTLEQIVKEFVEDLEKHRDQMVKKGAGSDEYGNLASAFMSSIAMLDENLVFALKHDMSFEEMYRALFVIERQGWIPVCILQVLWGLDKYWTKEVLRLFVSVSLAEWRTEILNGKRVSGAVLHDLQLDFVEAECKMHKEETKWHDKIITNWIPTLESSSSENAETKSQVRTWFRESQVFKDEYARNNVSRHLLRTGRWRDLKDLMRDPKWAVLRLRCREILGLERDCKLLVGMMKRSGEDFRKRGSDGWSLEMIVGAARLSVPCVSRNIDEVWFQLQARLFDLKAESALLREYANDIERCAGRPWLKALSPCLSGPGVLQSIIPCGGRVHGVQVKTDVEEIVTWGVEDWGHGFISTFLHGELVKRVLLREMCKKRRDTGGLRRDKEKNERTVEIQNLEGSNLDLSMVLSMCLSADGKVVVTGHSNGYVQMWSADSGEAIRKPLSGHRDKVRCVSFSGDDKLVASGSRDETVILWDVEKGSAVGKPLRGHSGSVYCVSWSRDGNHVASGGRDGSVRTWDVRIAGDVGKLLGKHDEHVLCVLWSSDGKRVASGGWDDVIRIWDVERGEAIGKPWKGQKSGVWCMSFSLDWKRALSGGQDGKVRIWDVEKGEVIGKPLGRHEETVLSVKWSNDGQQVLSCGWDATMGIWDVKREEVVRKRKGGHTSGILCVSWSRDGERVASGSWDETVRIWVAESGRPIGEPLRGHEGGVTCVSFSPDGQLIASGGYDFTVRIWDAKTGNAVGEPLQKHRSTVSAVTWVAENEIDYLISESRDERIVWNLKEEVKALKERNVDGLLSSEDKSDGGCLAISLRGSSVVYHGDGGQITLASRLSDAKSFGRSGGPHLGSLVQSPCGSRFSVHWGRRLEFFELVE